MLDQTEAALVIAQVTIVDARGAEQTAAVDARGVAVFDNLNPGTYQVKASADSFRPIATPFNVRRGENRTTLRLAVATIEQTVVVQDQSAADRRDNGFTQTLTQDQIDSLPDDPDEMAEELQRMAGPGAQIFVDGFRGGRLPPKDQIQQIRFHTNSFSAEYHEAGMIRVEVITKPGMGGWRGMTNFGFRDESLNATNAFADEKGAEQMRRYMVNFQGPIAKGKTGLTRLVRRQQLLRLADHRRAGAEHRHGQRAGEVPDDAMNFNARVEHLMGGANQLQPSMRGAQNDRSNLGVGDFDLPERAYATDNSTDTFRVRTTNVIGKKVFSEFRFSLIDSTLSTTSASTSPTVRVNDAFTAGGAGQMGDRHAREIELAQNFDFNIGRKHSMRAGLLFETGWWDSNQRSNAFGTYTFTSNDAFNAGTPATYAIRVGDPLVEYSQTKAGWFLQDDFRPSRDAAAQRSASARKSRRRSIRSGTSRRARRSPGTRRRRRPCVAATGSSTTGTTRTSTSRRSASTATHQIDVIVQNPGFPVIEGGGSAAAGQRDPFGVARPADHPPGLDRLRAPAHGVGGLPHRLHVDARQRHAAIDQRQRAGQRRAAGPDGRQHHRDPVDRQARVGSLHRRAERALRPAAHLGMVMYQLASTRNFADSATSLPSDSLNPNADWGPSAQDVRHRIFFNFNAPLGSGVRVSLNMQGSSALPYNVTTGLRRQRRHGVQRSSRRRRAQQRPRRVAVDREHPPEQVDRPRRRARRARRHADASAASASGRRRDEPARRRRSRWPRRRRRPADGGDGGRQREVPPRPVREHPERVQPRELQRVHRQPAVVVLRHPDLGGAAAANRARVLSRILKKERNRKTNNEYERRFAQLSGLIFVIRHSSFVIFLE